MKRNLEILDTCLYQRRHRSFTEQQPICTDQRLEAGAGCRPNMLNHIPMEQRLTKTMERKQLARLGVVHRQPDSEFCGKAF
jgi:hypothetical protein